MAGAPTPRTIGRRFRRSFTAFQRAGGPLSLVLVFGLRWNLRVKKRPAARQPGEVRRRLRCPIPSSQPHPATSASRGEHLTSAGRLPGLVPWPSSWCSPAAVDLAGPDPCGLPATPASWASTWPVPPRCRCWACSAPGSPDRFGLLATPASRASIWPALARCRCWACPAPGDPDPCGLQHPASHAREPGEHLADAGPLPRLDVLGTGRPRPLRPAGYARELGEHPADAGPLPRLDVLGTGRPRPLRPAGYARELGEQIGRAHV